MFYMPGTTEEQQDWYNFQDMVEAEGHRLANEKYYGHNVGMQQLGV
jgi:hypothetical protein